MQRRNFFYLLLFSYILFSQGSTAQCACVASAYDAFPVLEVVFVLEFVVVLRLTSDICDVISC